MANRGNKALKHDVENILAPMKAQQQHRSLAAAYLAMPPDAGSIQAAAETASKNRYKRRNRTKYSTAQVDILEATFQRNHYPDVNSFDTLADLLGLSPERISVWFQNRRARFKRMRKNGAAPELHAASSKNNKIDMEEIARAYSQQLAEIQDGKSDENTYDDDSTRSPGAAGEEEATGKAVVNEQSIDFSARSKSLAEIKQDLLDAAEEEEDEDEESRSGYPSLSSYNSSSSTAPPPPPAYHYPIAVDDSSGAGYADLSQSNFYYNQLMSSAANLEHYYQQQQQQQQQPYPSTSYPVHQLPTVPSPDPGVSESAPKAWNGYQYSPAAVLDQYYQSHLIPGGYFGHYASSAAAASYFYQSGHPYQQLPCTTYDQQQQQQAYDYQRPGNNAEAAYYQHHHGVSATLPSPAESVSSHNAGAGAGAGAGDSDSQTSSPPTPESDDQDEDA